MTIPPTCWTVKELWFDSRQGAFCSSSKCPHWLWSTTSLQLNRSKGELSPSIEGGVWQWPLTPYSVKNEWRYTSNPNTHWYVHRDSLTFHVVQRSWEAHTVILSIRKAKASVTSSPASMEPPRPRHNWSINPPPYMEPQVHSSVHNKPLLVHILHQINPTHSHTELLLIHFNIQSHLRLHFILDHIKSYNWTSVQISHLPWMLHAHAISSPLIFSKQYQL